MMAWKEIVAVMISLGCLASAETRYDGSKVLSVLHDDLDQIRELARKAHLDVWSQNHTSTELLVPKRKLGSVKRYLDKEDIPYFVVINDVQKLIDREQISTQMRRRIAGFSLDNYNRLDDIYKWMDFLSRKYPNMVSIQTIGYSYEKRPIRVAKISSGRRGAKAVFIDGGIHAREWVSTATVLYILNEVVENRSKLPSFMADIDFYILPVVNPDGYEYTHTSNRLWRKNRSKNPGRCLGTDLNRNFDAHFGGPGTSGRSCDEIYRGPYPFSELETKAVSNFILQIKEKLVAYIAFHSYSQLILLPYAYGYKKYPNDYNELEAIGKKAAVAIRKSGGEIYRVGTPGDILYPAAGGAYDWVKETAGVKYSFTYELRDTGSHGFILPARLIKPTAIEAFEGVKVMIEAAVGRN